MTTTLMTNRMTNQTTIPTMNNLSVKTVAPIPPANQLRLIVGAGGTAQPGWGSLEERDLDITDARQWESNFSPNSIDAILAEHVFEHLTPAESMAAARNFFTYLAPGGYARIAVPDGYHTDENYIAWVMPGTGFNGDDHKQLFNYKSLSQLLAGTGFIVQPLEFWDENGWFHSGPLNDEEGTIKRYLFGSNFFFLSLIVGCRYTSLTVDAIKPR